MSDSPNVKTNEVMYLLIDREEMSTGYQDLTGRFPQRSAKGNEYVLVGYHYDANCILGIPVRNRTAPELTTAWQKLHNIFKKAGCAPSTWVLDNEVSQTLTNAFAANDTTYQMVPPKSHRRNLAERSIQTWKNHFKAGLATVDPSFPLSAWDELIEQANITLNLLRATRINPALSAYTYIYGEFNFSATPMAPPGTKVVAHVKPDDRRTWELNGEVGYYVGPAMKHYRCVKCYFPQTRTTRICDTVTFIPHTIPIPEVNLTDFLRQAASDIVTILTHPPSSTVPSLQAGDPVRNALVTLATQLQRIQNIPQPTSSRNSSPTTITQIPVPPSTLSPTQENLHKAPSPRVKMKGSISPRVKLKASSYVPAKSLLQRSNLPKNSRFDNTLHHRYPLRSKLKSTATNFKNLAAQHLYAEQLFRHRVNHIYKPDGTKEKIDNLLQGPLKHIWNISLSNEWGRLAQGNKHGVTSTDTIDFIHQHEVPRDRDVTYATFVLDYRPLKAEPYRVRITCGGDKLSYPLDAGSPAADMLETKILINSTISDAHKGARFMSTDIKDFFLASPMDKPEYMRVKYDKIPEDIKQRYNLQDKVTQSNYV